MPIFKDDAYGTNINEQTKWIERENIKIIGVAIVDEGVKLRKSGFQGEILVLNQPMKEAISEIVNYRLTVGVADINFLKAIGKTKKKVTIHMEIETGMGRTGITKEQILEYIEQVKKYPTIKLNGIYTHFSCSDSDSKYTKKQIEKFEKCIQEVKERINTIKYIHCCNSAGSINFPEARYNMVRIGLILYGYYPEETLREKIILKPSMILKSKISFVKEVEEGYSISYGQTFKTQKKSRIATIPLGYADGMRRILSNKGTIIIQGKKARIVGNICMDCFMVDITEIPEVKVGDEVFIWDNKEITVEEIARLCGTIQYEIITTISKRVPRRYIQNNKRILS